MSLKISEMKSLKISKPVAGPKLHLPRCHMHAIISWCVVDPGRENIGAMTHPDQKSCTGPEPDPRAARLASQNLNIKIRFARLYLHIPQNRMEPPAWSFQRLANKKAQSATCFEHQTCNYLFIEQYICKTRFEVNFGVFPTNYTRMMSWNIKVC